MNRLLALALLTSSLLTGCISFGPRRGAAADLFDKHCDPLFDRGRPCLPTAERSTRIKAR